MIWADEIEIGPAEEDTCSQQGMKVGASIDSGPHQKNTGKVAQSTSSQRRRGEEVAAARTGDEDEAEAVAVETGDEVVRASGAYQKHTRTVARSTISQRRRGAKIATDRKRSNATSKSGTQQECALAVAPITNLKQIDGAVAAEMDQRRSSTQQREEEKSSNGEVQLKGDSSAGGGAEAQVITTWWRRGLSVKAISKPGERGKVSAHALRSQYHDPGD
jgi:hypothetical protein